MASSMWYWMVFTSILIIQSDNVEALKILGIFPTPGPSHFIPNKHLMIQLAHRGHQVDVVSHFPLKKPIPNYTDISLAGTAPQSGNNLTYADATRHHPLSRKQFVHKAGVMTCNLLSKDVFQQLLKSPKNQYDVIVVELFVSHCYVAFGKHLNAPVVGTVLSKLHDWLHGAFGVPLNTAYMPSLFSTSSQSMTFLERSQNAFLANLITFQMNYYLEDEREHVEKYFGRQISSMNELWDDIALVLVNSHHSINGIVPVPPGVVEVGGLHIHDDQQVLSADVQEWLDDSENGCVYFSFGSMVRIETFPPQTLKAFYEMFEKISPVRVLWKIADPTLLPPGLPKNVKTSPWLPQIAVFKHPNTKVFITHGGLIGTQEAVSYGIPMVAVPLFGDQHTNIQTCVQKKVAISLNHQEITGESLTNAVKAVLYDPSYSNNIKRLAKLFNDRPMSAMDTAIYWVEYAARHGKVLQSPATRLTWWQYYSLDVYGLALLILLLQLYIIDLASKFILKLIRSQRSPHAKTAAPKSKNHKQN